MTPPEKVLIAVAPDLARRVADRTTVGGDHTLVADAFRAALNRDPEVLVEQVAEVIHGFVGYKGRVPWAEAGPLTRGITTDAARAVLAAIGGEGQ